MNEEKSPLRIVKSPEDVKKLQEDVEVTKTLLHYTQIRDKLLGDYLNSLPQYPDPGEERFRKVNLEWKKTCHFATKKHPNIQMNLNALENEYRFVCEEARKLLEKNQKEAENKQ